MRGIELYSQLMMYTVEESYIYPSRQVIRNLQVIYSGRRPPQTRQERSRNATTVVDALWSHQTLHAMRY